MLDQVEVSREGGDDPLSDVVEQVMRLTLEAPNRQRIVERQNDLILN